MEGLIAQQSAIVDSMKRFLTNYKKDPKTRKTNPYFETRLSILSDYWKDFKENHKTIINLKAGNTEKCQEYFDTDTYGSLEEFFIQTKTLLEEDRLSLCPEVDRRDKKETPVFCEKVVEKVIEKEGVHLPNIKIPTFSGEYKHWMSFHDLFITLIHNNQALSNVRKLHYLKSSLQGEAEQLVRHYTITDSNYEPAWKALQERYDNKRILIKTQLNSLFSQPFTNTDTALTIRKLMDTTNECIQALENLKIDTKGWDIIFAHVVSERLPTDTKKLWEQEIGAEKEFPTYDKLKNFLEGRFRALESLDNKRSSRLVAQKHSFHSSNAYSCALCTGPHPVRQCSQFLSLDHNGRRNVVIQKHLCSNCLAKGHISSACPSRSSCFKCKYRHHTLLHDDSTIAKKVKPLQNDNSSVSKIAELNVEPSSNAFHAEYKWGHNDILLATALVKLVSDCGHEMVVRALIDQGSQSTFITETIVQRLRLTASPIRTTIMGLGNVSAGTVRSRVMVNMISLNNNNNIKVEALVLSTLTGILPSNRIHHSNSWNHLQGLALADPKYFLPGRIDMILGADVYCKIILSGLKTGSLGSPIAQNTIFGWILSGEIPRNPPKPVDSVMSAFHSYTSLNEQLRNFWEIEEVCTGRHFTFEEKLCEEHYVKTVNRLSDGRYMVRLPFKNLDFKPPFGKSRGSALSRLIHLEMQFAKSEKLHLEYSKCVQEYLDLQHMIPSASSEIENMCQDGNGKIFYKTNYLPHHAVFKDSTTTKLRVVFDASHKTFGGPSLNETLMTGPKIQDDLMWILLRWRKHRVVMTADIEKMYRQIRVHDQDAEYQRLLWRNSSNELIKDYKLQTVTFGTTSAPYLAVRTLHQLAKDERERYPLASGIAISDFYVDDLLTGTNTVEHGLELQEQLIRLLQSGGFHLRKWTSNKAELLEKIPSKDKEISGVREFDISESIKTLGINWHPKSDQFKYRLSANLGKDTKITKRNFLSDISKLFDPLGFLAPLTIKLKILMQVLWIRGTDWDEEIPTDILNTWQTVLNHLHLIEQIEIPRWIFTTANSAELHGFCDGSLHAYAAVLYIRSKDEHGNVVVRLLTAKTRVTPIKQMTVPRIELCGALLLARLYKMAKRAMNFDSITFRAWTDSTIVLSWLRGHPSKYKTFVANRIAEIQDICGNHIWNHVPTISNPADCATRGLLPTEMLRAELWWRGPDWLRKSEEWWPQFSAYDDNNLERKRVNINLCTSTEPSNFDLLILKHSSLMKLVRVSAYCLRFINLCTKKQKSRTKYLTTSELNKALNYWIKRAQAEAFKQELKDLESNSAAIGNLNNLNPFLDHDGILRVGGRLQHAKIPWTEKHPIILPNRDPLTSLIIDNVHKLTLHGGPQLMISILRQKYWVINVRNAVKHHVHKCVICFRQKSEHRNQLMGSLPSPRTQMSRPFEHVGVDYCGPLDIKSSKIKNAKIQKAYLAIFICLATRAIHIEVVSELTTQAFLAALKRFVGRRGLCTDIYSDNGTNFIGAKNILKDEFMQHLVNLEKKIPELVINEFINWHFIPPASPHFGGLWEAGVKSTKHHLKRIMGNSKLTFEELTTTVIQIEACLNSRPICPLTSDPEDVNALTPGHFLIGGPLLAIPEPSYLNQSEHRLNRWQYMQQLTQSFWKRWHMDYLNNLQQRPKWTTKTKNIEIGNLVLIREQNLPPCKWLLARVVETHPGSDGLVRVVTLKTKDTICKRAISKICLLPIEDNH